jgi:hypothetical protein
MDREQKIASEVNLKTQAFAPFAGQDWKQAKTDSRFWLDRFPFCKSMSEQDTASRYL